MRKFGAFFGISSLLILTFLTAPLPVSAILETNKFGIHLVAPQEVEKAAELVNSGGGNWGFVTIVIRDDELDRQRWQRFFDDCRELHLVPIIRIATHLEGDFWIKPKIEDIQKWADFLGNLVWPVKNQYVVIFNEPNHKNEWGNGINPHEYAQILQEAIKVFKQKSENFQVLPAGFDLACGNTSDTMNAFYFWQQMEEATPGIFQQLDVWTSHSYPNHGFVGTPYQKGKTSIRGYEWELSVLENTFGVKKDLPVFITETGWPYRLEASDRFYTQKKTAEFIQYAFENIWLKDERVVAVTPFLLFYPQLPFENFSWITRDGKETLQFEKVKGVPKAFWLPEQEFGFSLEKINLPRFMPAESKYAGTLVIKNTGQSIWGERGVLEFKPKIPDDKLEIPPLKIPDDLRIKPGESTEISFTIKTSTFSGNLTFSWEQFPDFELKVLPPSTLSRAEYSFYQRLTLGLKKIKLLFEGLR